MLNLFEVIIIGLVLSADSFSAALTMGFRKHSNADTLKFAFTSGLSEGLVAFIGAMAGAKILADFDLYDHWVSFSLLMAVALHMIYEGVVEHREKDKEKAPKEFHSFSKVLIVSLATSLDAFAIGVSLGVSGKILTPYIFSIGFWAFWATVAGMGMAKRFPSKLSPLFSMLGALILIGLASEILYTHLHL